MSSCIRKLSKSDLLESGYGQHEYPEKIYARLGGLVCLDGSPSSESGWRVVASSMSKGDEKGMHVSVDVNVSIAREQQQIEENQDCDDSNSNEEEEGLESFAFSFLLPDGIFVDEYELVNRHIFDGLGEAKVYPEMLIRDAGETLIKGIVDADSFLDVLKYTQVLVIQSEISKHKHKKEEAEAVDEVGQRQGQRQGKAKRVRRFNFKLPVHIRYHAAANATQSNSTKEPRRDVFMPVPIVYHCNSNKQTRTGVELPNPGQSGQSERTQHLDSCSILPLRHLQGIQNQEHGNGNGGDTHAQAQATSLLRLSMPVGSLDSMESVHLVTLLVQYTTFAMLMLVLFMKK